MRRCAKFTVFLAFVLACDVASGQFLNPYAGTIILQPDESIVCESQLECVADRCDQGRWCVQSGDKLVQYAVLSCDQATPERYCNGGICSKSPLPRCESSEFTCPSVNGVYPDPSSCRRYHICNDGVVRTNNCPLNNVYDHETGGCKLQVHSGDCVQFRCGIRDGQPIVYPRDDRIYGRCFSGKAYISGRCKDHEKYNLISQQCERHCRSASTQPPDPGHCGKFILCAEVSPRRYQMVEMTCGCDQAYDENEKRCVLNHPCVADTPEIQCKSKDVSIEQPGNGGEQPPPSTGDSSENPKGNEDEEGDPLGSKQRRSLYSFMNRYNGSRQNNNDNSNDDNVPPALINDNLHDDNVDSNGDYDIKENLINTDGDYDIKKNLINTDDNNNDNTYNDDNNNDNAEDPAIKLGANFIRIIIDWIIRIIVGPPA